MTAETKVGLFTFFGVVLLGFSIYLLGNFTVSSGYDIDVYFKNVSGLPAKSVVRLNGVEVGKVKALKIDGDKVLAIVRINDGIVIYKDSKFTISATSLIGTNFLQIDQGLPLSGVLKGGDIVQGISQASVTDMITDTMATVRDLTAGIGANGQFADDLNNTLKNLRQLSGNMNELIMSLKPYLSSSMQDVSELTKASRELVNKLDSGNGLFAALVDDQKMKTDAQETLANIKQVTEDAKKFIGGMAKFRMFWGYEARFQPNGGIMESDVYLKLMPNNGFSYYRVGISDLGSDDNMPRNDKDYRGEPNRFDARIGLYNDWVDVSVGLIRGAGGGVLAFKPFFKSQTEFIKSFSIYGEAFDWDRNRVINNRLFDKPNISVGVRTDITKNIGVGIRYSDMLEASSLQFTGSILFEDKELASLLGLATLAK